MFSPQLLKLCQKGRCNRSLTCSTDLFVIIELCVEYNRELFNCV